MYHMKTIFIKAHKVFRSSIVSSHRTSNGWIYDEEETTSCEIWTSEPIVFQTDPNKVLQFIDQTIDNLKFNSNTLCKKMSQFLLRK